MKIPPSLLVPCVLLSIAAPFLGAAEEAASQLRPWPSYRVIMWVGGDMLMFFGMVPVAVLWVRHEERRALELDRQLDEVRTSRSPAPVEES